MCSLQIKVWVPCVIRGGKLQYITKNISKHINFFVYKLYVTQENRNDIYILAFKYIRYQ